MREIKFRAWNKSLKGMYTTFALTMNGKILGANGDGAYAPLSNDRDNYDLMQFTGLKDKTGKEIYEGDIVRILYTDWPSKAIEDKRTLEQYLVDIAQVKVVIWKVQGFYVSHKIDGYAESMEPGRHGYIEVIGNIYEYPDLIK